MFFCEDFWLMNRKQDQDGRPTAKQLRDFWLMNRKQDQNSSAPSSFKVDRAVAKK